MPKIMLILTAIAAMFVAVLLFLNFSAKAVLPGQISQLGHEVEIKDVTFRGYKSQNISFEKDEAKVLMQTVNNVERDMVKKILAELTAPIVDAKKDTTIFNPYIAQEVTLSVPEELKPLKKETTIRGQTVDYYLVYANVIFSMMVYSEAEVRYKGLFAAYFCENDNTTRKLEIYYPAEEEFDEEKALNLFSSLYCSG